MIRRSRVLSWLFMFVLVAIPPATTLHAQSESDDLLVLLTTIETDGQPSAIVVDHSVGRNDVIFYDGDRVRFVDGDTLTLLPESS